MKLYIRLFGSTHPLATVDIEPSLAVIKKGDTHLFTASGFDQYGNAIPDLAFLWESEGGEITEAGLYNASKSGSFPVTATATLKASKRSGSAVADVPLIAYWPGDGNTDDVAGSPLRTCHLLPQFCYSLPATRYWSYH